MFYKMFGFQNDFVCVLISGLNLRYSNNNLIFSVFLDSLC